MVHDALKMEHPQGMGWGATGIISWAVRRYGMCLPGSPAPGGCAQGSWNPLQAFVKREQKALAWSVFCQP